MCAAMSESSSNPSALRTCNSLSLTEHECVVQDKVMKKHLAANVCCDIGLMGDHFGNGFIFKQKSHHRSMALNRQRNLRLNLTVHLLFLWEHLLEGGHRHRHQKTHQMTASCLPYACVHVSYGDACVCPFCGDACVCPSCDGDAYGATPKKSPHPNPHLAAVSVAATVVEFLVAAAIAAEFLVAVATVVGIPGAAAIVVVVHTDKDTDTDIGTEAVACIGCCCWRNCYC